jgi:hypothetical protein
MRANIRRVVALALVTVFAVSWAVAEEGYDLIDAAEFSRSLAAPDDDEEFFSRDVDPLAPEIQVKKPGEGSDYEAPIDIELSFLSVAGAEIDLDSLKITYGSLGINVTERVTEHATVTTTGILSKGAKLPAGRHKLTVSIADDQGRVGKRRFKFRIVE